MTTIKITTSQSVCVVEIASPVDEVMEIRYEDCLYCGLPFRKKETAPHQKFHSSYCRRYYDFHGIAECETQPRHAAVLSKR